MKKISIIVASIVLLATVFTVQSCKSSSKATTGQALKFNLEKGKGYDYAMIWDMDTKAAGQTTAVTINALYNMTVTGIENNIREITTEYKSMKMKMSTMGMNIEIDSDKPVSSTEKADMKANPMGAMNKMFNGIIGKKFIIKVDEEGKVLSVDGFDRIILGMIDSMGLDGAAKQQVEASMKDQFNDQSIKDQFAQIFTIFPNKEVKVGDSWEKAFSTGGKMAAKYNTTYTVKAIEGSHVTLGTKTNIGSSEGGAETSGTQTGDMIVDSKTGLLINAEFDQDIKVKTQGITVDVVGKGKITGKAN